MTLCFDSSRRGTEFPSYLPGLVNTQVGKWRLDFLCDHNKCTLSLQGSQKLGDFHLSHKQTSGVYYLPSALWPQGIAEKQNKNRHTAFMEFWVLPATEPCRDAIPTVEVVGISCVLGHYLMTRLLQRTAGYNWSSTAIFIICDTVLVAGLEQLRALPGLTVLLPSTHQTLASSLRSATHCLPKGAFSDWKYAVLTIPSATLHQCEWELGDQCLSLCPEKGDSEEQTSWDLRRS